MRRREVLAGLASGTAAAWSPVVGAQQAAERPRRIGVLTPQSGDDTELRRWLSGFTDSLRQLGWVEGRNLHIEYRAAAGDLVRLGRQAAELVGLKSDVILAHSTPATRAMRQATDMIPIVFVKSPIRSVAALSRASPIPAATSPASRISMPQWVGSGSSF